MSFETAKRLESLRTEFGLDHNGIAQLLRVHPSTVLGWECGKSVPNPQNLRRLSAFYNVSEDYLRGKTAIRGEAESTPEADLYMELHKLREKNKSLDDRNLMLYRQSTQLQMQLKKAEDDVEKYRLLAGNATQTSSKLKNAHAEIDRLKRQIERIEKANYELKRDHDSDQQLLTDQNFLLQQQRRKLPILSAALVACVIALAFSLFHGHAPNDTKKASSYSSGQTRASVASTATARPTANPLALLSIQQPTQPPKKTSMVWISSSGKCYHKKSTCSNMSAPRQVTVEEAKSRGRRPCSKCY